MLLLKGSVFLQAGDLSGSYEQYCASPADILKAAHHGSPSSTLTDFIASVSPDTILLSCRNMSRLQDFRERISGSAVYGTPDCGAITLHFEENRYTVIPFLHQ